MNIEGGGLFIGCAGWSLSQAYKPAFIDEGTHLQRYASRLNAVEINSSFYRPHRPGTYANWAASVPQAFRFCVKVPRQITHVQRLKDCEALIETFLTQCSALDDKLGCLLVQLPPSLAFDAWTAERFFEALRQHYCGPVVLEPRHESWVQAGPLLAAQRIAQASVDPSRVSNDSVPEGWRGIRYWRLHGSPRIYHSAYDNTWLERMATELKAAVAEGARAWCIFDNTASGAALGNALDLMMRMKA